MKPARIPNSNSSTERGFTLVELLVVLATLVILALPLLAITTKDQIIAQQLRCANNLKQLRSYSLMYAADARNLFLSPPSGGNGWAQNLQGYCANVTNLVMCPAAAKAPSGSGGQAQGSADQYWIRFNSIAGTTYAGSLGINGWFYSDKSGDGVAFTLPNGKPGSSGYFAGDSTVAKPALTPVFFDENWIDTWPTEADAPCTNLYQGRTYSAHKDEIGRLTIVRHGGLAPANAPQNLTENLVLPGAVNMAFYDGHVELVRLEGLWTFYWYAGCTPRPSGHPAP
jgi:prepilin-type N-terminal cleavage/methylation domain-containing protein/prepilin-type processing-associated H-X9-DG protein